MGNEIQVTSLASGKNTRVFKFTKQDSSGQTLEMTATIFDRNKRSNQMQNTEALPTDMIIDSNDAIQFGGKDIAQFKAPEIAPFSGVLFKDYDETVYEPGTEKDSEASVSYNAKGISDVTLNTAKPMKLGQFKDALEHINYAQSGNQTPAGGQAPVGGNGVPTPENFFQMSIPDIRALTNVMEESGFRGCMLMPDISATPYVMCADMDRALDAIFKPFMLNLKGMMERSSGGYVPNSTPSGQTSGSDSSPSPAETAADKKAKADAEAARKAEEAEEKAKKELIEAAKKKREEKVAKIIDAIFNATNGAGTEEEDLEAAIKDINKDNVLEVLETWEKSPQAGKMDKSLIDTIKNDTDGFWGMGSDEDKYLKPIAEALRARSNSKDANLLADLINSDFDAEDVKKLYELVKKESNDPEKPLADPIDVKIEKQFEAKKEAEDKLKEKKEKAVTDAKDAATQAKQELDKATKFTALKDEAIKIGVVPTAEDTIETLTAKIKDAKSKKNKKPLTKAEKAQQKADLEAARQEQLAEARRNEQLKENAKKAAEKVKKAEEEASKPVSVKLPAPKTPEEVRAANKKAKEENEAGKVHNEDKTPIWHIWGTTAPKLKAGAVAVEQKAIEAPKKEAVPTPAVSAPAPASAPAANPERDAKIAEYKEVMKKYQEAQKAEVKGGDPQKVKDLDNKLEGLIKDLLKLGFNNRDEITAIK